jgi:integrase
MKLTEKVVKVLTLPDDKNDIVVFDDELKRFGFRLRRSHDGSAVLKSWTVQYRHGGRKPRIKLGDYGVLSAEKARVAARKLLAKVDLGEDPQADRRERRDKDALTMRSQVVEFLAAKQKKLRPRSFVETSRYLTDPKYFGPLHQRPLDAITLPDVSARIVAIARERGDPTAARARGALVTFFVWAMRMGLARVNPCVESISPETHGRERVLTPNELVAIWNVCGGDDHFGKIIRLLILLGARRQEIGGIAGSELDLESPEPSWTLPAARSKNKRPHKLPLMPMALAIIRSVPRLVSRDRLFGSSAARGFTAWAKSKAALDRRSGVAGWTIHDVRRSIATMMADIGIAPHVIEQILNHQSGHKSGVAGVYNRSRYEREVRAALALWEDHIRTLVDGGERKVVPIDAPRLSQR